jgi:hypothetical protein
MLGAPGRELLAQLTLRVEGLRAEILEEQVRVVS